MVRIKYAGSKSVPRKGRISRTDKTDELMHQINWTHSTQAKKKKKVF